MNNPTPLELLQTLVRFDTTNPPGNEVACIGHINHVLTYGGFTPTLLAKDAARPNLIARLPGRGDAPPVLWQAHVDVVTTADQDWQQPPFAGNIVDGELWGRGTLDDKGHAAMMISALLRAKSAGITPPGDIIFVALADEEAGGNYGAKFLVEHHAAHFEGVHYAIGEGGGFSVQMGASTFYPIMVAEKQICSIKLTVTGKAGHGSMPLRGQAMAKLATVLRKLDRRRLPVHISPTTQAMIHTIAEKQAPLQRLMMRQLLNPAFTDRILDLIGSTGQKLNASLHNTASPTMVRGGHKINVIPSEISVALDGRLLPGFGPDDMVNELCALLGEDVSIEVTQYEPGPPAADLERYTVLADIIRIADPRGTPFPHLLSGVTDARHFAQLGIRTYGFSPIQLPAGDTAHGDHISTIHAANERIPVDTLEWGTQVMLETLKTFKG